MKPILALAALAFAGAAAPSAQVLREQAWTDPSGPPGRDLAYAMTHAPAECYLGLNLQGPSAEAGRALFRSPVLLGGPAARSGLSCNACHSSGRINARFLLPELTNRAGAADVTSEWASHARGDGVMNPVDIPDLVGVGTRPAFGRARNPSLENFVRSVIVEEFQGAEPPAQALGMVLSYLHALSATECLAADEPITLASAADDVRRALNTAAILRDAETSNLVIAAAQDAMGRIVERLPARTFGSERWRLETLSRELTAMRSDEAWRERLPQWRARFDGAVARIARRERRTYFNETALRAALSRSRR